MTSYQIYQDVVKAMQPAEELGGPEGADYTSLMVAIIKEAADRIRTFALNTSETKG